jgi:hypothetical protein
MKALALKKSLIVLRPHDRRAERRRMIQQIDLEEYLLLTREMRESEQRWKEKRKYLKKLVEAGATVEQGVHTAWLERRCRTHVLCPTEYKILRVS